MKKNGKAGKRKWPKKDEKGECYACVREKVMIYREQQTFHAHKQIAN